MVNVIKNIPDGLESSYSQYPDVETVSSLSLSQHGLVPTDGVNEIRPKDMFEEVDVPNVLRLSSKAKQWKVRFTDGIYDINQSDFQLPKVPFAPGATDELLDYSQHGTTTQVDHSKGDIVVNGNSGDVNIPDQAYIAKTSTTAGTLVTNTSKFKPIPYVTKQVALLIEKTSSGAIVNTVKPLVNMYGEESVLTYEEDIMGELGFAQKSDRVWTDGSSEYILIGLKGYLNAGAYHPWYNVFGCEGFNHSDYINHPDYIRAWYSCNTSSAIGRFAVSIYDCLHSPYKANYYGSLENTTVGTSFANPASKFYDKCYIEGQGGLVCFAIPNAKTPTYKHFEEVRRNLNDGYIENGFELNYMPQVNIVTRSGSTSSYSYTNSNGTTYFSVTSSLPNNTRIYEKPLSVYNNTYIQIFGNGNVLTVKPNSNSINLIYANYDGNSCYIYGSGDIRSEIDTKFPDGTQLSFVFKYKSPYLVTQGSATHTDIIGDPASYPQDLKDLLAQGQGVGFCNALLVGQDGTNYIGTSTVGIVSSKKLIINKEQLLELDNTNVWTKRVFTVGTSAFHEKPNRIEYNFWNSDTKMIVLQYQAQNQSAVPIQIPQPVQAIDRNLIASNSYSVYSYNGLTYATTTKVATGEAVETKYGENIALAEYDDIIIADGVTTNTVKVGKRYLVLGGLYDGEIWTRIGSDHTGSFPTNFNFSSYDGTYYRDKGFLRLKAKHNTITLDSNSIVASKALLTQTAKGTQVFAQELLYDSTNGDFGDTGEFEQLAPGKITDLNGNTVKTKILYKPSSIKLGDEQ